MEELLAERAIERVLLRYARGVDRLDRDLVERCYWPDAVDHHGAFTGLREEFIDWAFPLLERHWATMHHLANITVELDPDGVHAGAETYGVAYHCGEPADDIRWSNVSGFRYVDAFERRGDEWRIAQRVVAIEFVAPWSPSLAWVERLGPRLPRRGDRTDPVYDHGRALRVGERRAGGARRAGDRGR